MTEELIGAHRHEPGEEGSKDTYDLEMELQRQRI